MQNNGALYLTRAVANNILKVNIRKITAALYSGKIKRPHMKVSSSYAWSFPEIRQAAEALDAMDAFKEFFTEKSKPEGVILAQ